MNNQLDLMRARLNVRGGEAQQDRMIKDKRASLDKAILYSYQGARIKKIGSDTIVTALINPNKLKQDYDDKIISLGYEFGIKTGDVFEWVNTDTKWLVYLQDLTELAYFRGEIRRCNYKITWEDEKDNVYSTYAAVRGPVETKINFIQKNGISVDEPNHSLNILIPNNKDALKYFKRYSKFYLQTEGDTPICWRVEAVDSISMPNIIEIAAVEYYANEIEDDVENGIVGGLVFEPQEVISDIEGKGFIKPKLDYTYTYTGEEDASWGYEAGLPIEVKVDGKSITVTWLKTYSGEFELCYGNSKKTIVVESLF